MTTKKQINENELTREILVGDNIFPIEAETYYRDFLNDCCQEVEIGSLKYGAGRVLEKIDPVAFRTGMLDHFDCLKKDGEVLEVEGFYFWLHEIKETFEITEDGE
jgi:hypothetical protein